MCEANAMVGGDNAARAVAIGMVLGSYHGVHAIPQEWNRPASSHARAPFQIFSGVAEHIERLAKGREQSGKGAETEAEKLLQKLPLVSKEAEL